MGQGTTRRYFKHGTSKERKNNGILREQIERKGRRSEEAIEAKGNEINLVTRKNETEKFQPVEGEAAMEKV